jgi:precorrin-8X/cobalt-precorrin-8 methylmutase
VAEPGPIEVHPIEIDSYAIMRVRVDFSKWPPGAREVVERVVHATADEAFNDSMRVGAHAVTAAISALRAGAAVVCDARMVLAGISAVPNACCHLSDRAAPSGATRSAAAVDHAVSRHGDGAIWVFGNAPTALVRLVELHAGGSVRPAAVIGLPVGYVGAAESKELLWESELAPVSVTNIGRRGGSSSAAAVVNALRRLATQLPR